MAQIIHRIKIGEILQNCDIYIVHTNSDFYDLNCNSENRNWGQGGLA